MTDSSYRLPEKSYFSVQELASRWGCPEETVVHYLEEGWIRPAIKQDEIHRLDLIDLALLEKREERNGRGLPPAGWGADWRDISQETANEASGCISWEALRNDFFYISRQCIQHVGDDSVVFRVEDLCSKLYGLTDVAGTYQPVSHDVSRLIIRGAESPHFWRRHPFSWNPNGGNHSPRGEGSIRTRIWFDRF